MAEINKWMIDPNDAVMLLIDHQSGLFQLVRDIDLPTLRAHVTALAKVARLAKIPTFTTASVPDGPNGPLIPEIHQYNPEAVYIPRTGQINAWDNPAWVEGHREDQAQDAPHRRHAHERLHGVPHAQRPRRRVQGLHASSTPRATGRKMATDLTLARVVQAGAMPIDTYAVLAELMSTWNRPDAMEFAAVMVDHIVPPYRALMESYDKAQSVQKVGRETKLDRLEAARK